MLHRFIEIFEGKGWLDKRLRIRYQKKRYWISCNEEGFFAYQINDHCGPGPGMPGWPVCMVTKDYVYDESDIPDFTPTKLKAQDWLNITSSQGLELV